MTDKDASQPPPAAPANDAREPTALDANDLVRTAGAIIDSIAALLPEPKPKVVRVLDYPEVIRFFVNSHPHRPSVRCGVVVRTPVPRGWLVSQVFLDAQPGGVSERPASPGESEWLAAVGDLRVRVATGEDGRPLGRHVVARRVGAELAERFGDSDVLLIT
jgi:hypothetical protein